jgi:hypothetical protein
MLSAFLRANIGITLYAAWSRVLLEKLTDLQLVKKFLLFMEPEVSLPHSQVSATFPYPDPYPFSPCPHNPLPDDPF